MSITRAESCDAIDISCEMFRLAPAREASVCKNKPAIGFRVSALFLHPSGRMESRRIDYSRLALLSEKSRTLDFFSQRLLSTEVISCKDFLRCLSRTKPIQKIPHFINDVSSVVNVRTCFHVRFYSLFGSCIQRFLSPTFIMRVSSCKQRKFTR